MRNEKEKSKDRKVKADRETTRPKEQRSSAFREPKEQDQKSTVNREEADLEQERKEAMTERD